MTTAPAISEYLMPSLGSDMDEGTIIEWNVTVGDEVTRGDIVARVETEKSDIDIEIWHGGVVDEILVPPGRLVAVGTPLLRFVADEVDADVDPAAFGPAAERTAASAAEPAAQRGGDVGIDDASVGRPPETRPATGTDRVWATPLARRLAGEQGVVLADVEGSGPNHAVRSRDVLGHLHVDPTAVDDGPAAPVAPADRSDRMRRVIAARMSKSNAEIPHYQLERQVDLTALEERLSATNAQLPISERLLPAAAFIRATALAAARHGELNGHWLDGRFVPAQRVDVAVAISRRDGGLVTPHINDADHCDLAATMEQLRTLTAGARSGILRSDATAGASTITVTNLGERGADRVYGLISPPEVALVGFGRPVERPWVVDGEVRVRRIVSVTLGADHRATDGATGSRFLSTIAHLLEHPEDL